MRIWIIKTGEPWPTDGEYPRLLRSGVMARRYARAGDDVTWFNATFDHFTKTHRHDREVTLEVEPHLQLVGLHSRGYRRNVSLARIRDHREAGAAFQNRAQHMTPPDVIVAAMPTLELAAAAVEYGRTRGIPVVVDVRDMWPDIWRDLAPRPFRPIATLALSGYYRMLQRIVDGAAAVCGISEQAVDWALRHGTRPRNAFDGALPLAYEAPELTRDASARADAFWDEAGIRRAEGRCIFCFFGSLSPRIDIGTVIEAALRVPAEMHERIRVVVCGRGAWEVRLSEAARRTPVLCAPGWVDGAQIVRLMARADVGLLPYFNTHDFRMSYPNKVFDYLTGGLPILTSLTGVTGALVRDQGCGWQYDGDLAAHLTALTLDGNARAAAAARVRSVSRQFAADSVYDAFRERLSRLVQAAKGAAAVENIP